MSHEATMAEYLLEIGWQLHLSDNTGRPHMLVAVRSSGNVTRFDQCAISADAVLELHQSGKMKRHGQFSLGDKTTTVFVSKEPRNGYTIKQET